MQTKRSSSRRKPLSVLALFPLAALLVFGMVNYNFSPPTEFEAVQQSNILLSAIRASLYMAGGLFFMIQLKRNFRFVLRRFELIASVLFVMASATWTAHIDRQMISTLHFLGSITVVYVAAIYFTQSTKRWALYPFLAVLFGTFSIVSLGVSLFWDSFGTVYYQWEDVTRWRGLTSNANVLGWLSMLTVWASLAAYINTEHKKHRILYVLFVAAAIACLWGSDSKTSQIVTFLTVAVTLLAKFFYGTSSASSKKRLVFAVYALITIVVISMLFFADFFVADRMAASVGRDSNLSGRDVVWGDAMKMISIKPIVGWSFDGRATAYDFISQPYSQYHNGYLDLGVRGGFAAILLFGLFLIRHFRVLLKMLKVKPNEYGPLLAISVGFLVHNLTEATLAAFDHALWILMLLVYFLAERGLKRERHRHRRKKNKFVKLASKAQKKVME